MLDMTMNLGDIIFLTVLVGLNVWIWGFWGKEQKDKKNKETNNKVIENK